MNKHPRRHHSGFVLLIFLVAIMGIGGLMMVGYSQSILKEVELNRFEHNQEILLQAKQALLMYAYLYPKNYSRGPGRLPCPYDELDGYSSDSVSKEKCELVGRLPWKHAKLDSYEARDASGEHLWYAVSWKFRNLDTIESTNINSDSRGTITVFDQTGATLYDGAASGIAAVIIAPGPALSRDEDNDGIYETPQLRNTLEQMVDPQNYLDTYNGFDNSVFTNGDSDDGFILGPVREPDPASPSNNILVVNDQIMIITAEEVIAMAEKATLEAYRQAIDAYLKFTGYSYPWLFDYSVFDLEDYPTSTPRFSDNLTHIGRIPSMFSRYFKADKVDGDALPGELWIQLGFGNTTEWSSKFPVFLEQVMIDFDGAGNLNAVLPNKPPPQALYFFWDDQVPAGEESWKLCANGGYLSSDCNRDASGILNPSLPQSLKVTKVREVYLVFNTLALNQVFKLADLVHTPFSMTDCDVVGNCLPADASRHAYISAEYNQGIFDRLVNSMTYTQWNNNTINDFAGEDFDDSGTINILASDRSIRVGVRFYPELPAWAKTNDWHNSIQMAYAEAYRPDNLAVACSEGTDCIQVYGLAGNNDNKISILLIAGQHDWQDGDPDNPLFNPVDGFYNDLGDVFEGENSDLDRFFDASSLPGKNKIMIIEECGASECL